MEEGNKDEVYFIIDKFYDKIKKSSEVLKNSEKTIFDENDIIITKEEKDKLHFLENGFWDLKSRHSEKLVVEEDDDFEEENEEPDEEEEETDVDDNYYDEDEVEDDSDNDLKDLVVIDDEDNMSE